MIDYDGTGRGLLSYTVTAKIARIPIERHGVSQKGTEWVLGGCLLEVYEEGQNGSARIYVATFDPEMIETLNKIGEGKRIRATFHVDTKEYYSSYRTSLMLDTIEGVTDGESFLYGLGKKEDR